MRPYQIRDHTFNRDVRLQRKLFHVHYRTNVILADVIKMDLFHFNLETQRAMFKMHSLTMIHELHSFQFLDINETQ